MRKFHTVSASALLCGALMLVTPAFSADEKGDAVKGKDTFDNQCAGCHNADSTEKKMGPGLKGLFTKDALKNGDKPTSENVLKKINEGGNGMPGYADMLSDSEKKDLLAYLQTL